MPTPARPGTPDHRDPTQLQTYEIDYELLLDSRVVHAWTTGWPESSGARLSKLTGGATGGSSGPHPMVYRCELSDIQKSDSPMGAMMQAMALLSLNAPTAFTVIRATITLLRPPIQVSR